MRGEFYWKYVNNGIGYLPGPAANLKDPSGGVAGLKSYDTTTSCNTAAKMYNIPPGGKIQIRIPHVKNKYLPNSFTISFWMKSTNALTATTDIVTIMNQFKIKTSNDVATGTDQLFNPFVIDENLSEQGFTVIGNPTDITPQICVSSQWCFVGMTFHLDKTNFQVAAVESSDGFQRFHDFNTIAAVKLAPANDRIIFENFEGQVSNLNIKPYGGIFGAAKVDLRRQVF
jgi:hypothetical protein